LFFFGGVVFRKSKLGIVHKEQSYHKFKRCQVKFAKLSNFSSEVETAALAHYMCSVVWSPTFTQENEKTLKM